MSEYTTHTQLYAYGNESKAVIVLVKPRYRTAMIKWLKYQGVAVLMMDIDLPLHDAELDDLTIAYMGLRTQYQSVGLMAFGEYSVYGLCGAVLCDGLSMVVAVSPMDRIFESLRLGTSQLTHHGVPVDYHPFGMDATGLKRLYRHYSRRYHESRHIELYEYALLKNDHPSCIIDVSKIKAPLYLFSSADDAYWNSREAARRIKAQLSEAHFAYPFKHVLYKRGAHDLLPIAVYNRGSSIFDYNKPGTQASRNDLQVMLESLIQSVL